MSIPVVRKPDDVDVENCHFCKYMTRYWHRETSIPVCSVCAERREISELPNQRKQHNAKQEDAGHEQ